MNWVTLLFNFFKTSAAASAVRKAAATANSDGAREFRSRVLWEIVAVIISIAFGYLISHFTGKTDLRACQDERELLLRQHRQNQIIVDSLRFSRQIATKDYQISQKDEEILLLRQRVRSDSLAHLSELEAIRAINQALRRR